MLLIHQVISFQFKVSVSNKDNGVRKLEAKRSRDLGFCFTIAPWIVGGTV